MSGNSTWRLCLGLGVLRLQVCDFFSLFSVVSGIMVLAGWMFDIPVLKSVLPWFVTMKANTAIGFIVSGLSLALLARTGRSVLELRMSQVFASVTVLLGLLNICQYLFGLDLGIGQLFFHEPANAVGAPYPGACLFLRQSTFYFWALPCFLQITITAFGLLKYWF